MKITDNESLRAGQITPATSVASTPAFSQAASAYGKGAAPAAQVEFSDKAQAIAVAAVAVDQSSDVRDGLVTRLKAQVDAGTYQVSGKDIADQMIRRAKADSIR